MRTPWLGWHFLAVDRRLQFGEIVEAGKTYTTEGALRSCQNDMYASLRALDALTYAAGPIVCRMQLRGEILHDMDKAVARSRHVLWLSDATHVLHEFALSVATDALEFTDTTDPRCWAALDAKTRWLRGYVTDQELDAAKAAAGAAAGDAAWAAAGAAAWAAVWAAAENAAWAAAWAAGFAAAGAPSRAVAWDAYNFQLEMMLQSLRGSR